MRELLLTVDGERIMSLRGKLNLSRKECAQRANISVDTLRRLERENCCARPETMLAIGEVLSVNPKTLAKPKKRLRALEAVSDAVLGGGVAKRVGIFVATLPMQQFLGIYF